MLPGPLLEIVQHEMAATCPKSGKGGSIERPTRREYFPIQSPISNFC
jgi:hypothetical protein